jgi:flagellar M-ring protein FliF
MSAHAQQPAVDGRQEYSGGAVFRPGLIVLLLGGIYVAGFVILLWLTMPDYVELYNGIDANKATAVTSELQSAGISYHFEPSSGTLMVQAGQLELARSILTEKGLLDRFDLSGGQHNPEFIADYSQAPGRHALPHQILEAELAKSIASIDNVQSARVHLALPGVAGNDQNQTSRASVVVRLYPGRRLSESQVTSIAHLVAASIANLSADRITIIDQTGQLLKPAGTSNGTSLSTGQFGYLRSLEQSYINRIEEILTPVLGMNALRIQVVADVDFKAFNMDTVENPPPIAHTVEKGTVRRLTATVIVDNQFVDDGDGKVTKVPRSNEELQRTTELIKQAIGFNGQRGDTVTVINEPFSRMANQYDSPTVSIWERLQHRNSVWYLAIGCLLLVIVGITVRTLRIGTRVSQVLPVPSAAALAPDVQFSNEDHSAQHNSSGTSGGAGDQKKSLEQQLLKARQLVRDDPKTVAQLVRTWMKENG